MPAHKNGPGTGFTGLNAYLDANSGTINDQANGLANDAGAQAAGAQGRANALAGDAYTQGAATGNYDPTTAGGYGGALNSQTAAVDALHNLQSPGGVVSALHAKYGNANAGATDNFDAALFGGSQAAQGAFNAVNQKYGGLDSYLQNQTGDAANRGNAAYKPPPDPAAAPAPVFSDGNADGGQDEKQAQVGMKLNPTGSAHGYQDDGDWTGATVRHPGRALAPPGTAPAAPAAPGGTFGKDTTTNDPAQTKRGSNGSF